VSTPVTTTPEVTQDDADTGYAPSERRVMVNAIPETDAEWPTHVDEETEGSEPHSEALAPQTYTRTPSRAWPDEDGAEAPSHEALEPTVAPAPDAHDESEQPTRESARPWQPDAVAEEPQPATEPEREPSSEQPEPVPSEKPHEKPADKPAEEPQAQPKPDAGTEVEPQPEPCPPAAEPKPEPKPEPEPEPCPPGQAPEPAAQTPEPQPEPATQPAPPAPEQAPATPPCP
jgi:hypothetical protein